MDMIVSSDISDGLLGLKMPLMNSITSNLLFSSQQSKKENLKTTSTSNSLVDTSLDGEFVKL